VCCRLLAEKAVAFYAAKGQQQPKRGKVVEAFGGNKGAARRAAQYASHQRGRKRAAGDPDAPARRISPPLLTEKEDREVVAAAAAEAAAYSATGSTSVKGLTRPLEEQINRGRKGRGLEALAGDLGRIHKGLRTALSAAFL